MEILLFFYSKLLSCDNYIIEKGFLKIVLLIIKLYQQVDGFKTRIK